MCGSAPVARRWSLRTPADDGSRPPGAEGLPLPAGFRAGGRTDRLRRVKAFLRGLDEKFGTRLFDGCKAVHHRARAFLDPLRRRVEPLGVRLRYALGAPGNADHVRLHLGCGNIRLDGFVNVDWRATGATDLVCDIRRLPYPDGSVQRIETYHVLEHLSHADALDALREWHRTLVPGGRLVIECPDFDESVRRYLAGDDSRLEEIFGIRRFPGDEHKFGWNTRRLCDALAGIGYRDVSAKAPTDYHAAKHPCIRVECVK
jgi:predicted SAM-dependent methyltransferase